MVEDDAAAATEGGNGHGLGYLQKTARERRNVFEALVEAVKTHSLGQISHALYDVGGGVSAEYVTAVAPLGITTVQRLAQSVCQQLMMDELRLAGTNDA